MHKSSKWTLALAALGIVFGDIGTSPLYAFKECLAHGLTSQTDIFGVISLIAWSMITLVSVKYIGFMMKADNNGEGGILSLLSLIFQKVSNKSPLLLGMAVFGAALMYGDGIITPAISVLSATEGLALISPKFEPLIIPLTITILICLFAMQRKGTGTIGKVFGPIMLVWFSVLFILGFLQVIQNPSVLQALNPYYGFAFLFSHGTAAFLVMGSVFLVVTGGEALYADMGHFGRKPIAIAWYSIAFPALMMNYLGQAALVLNNPEFAKNPFYFMASPAFQIPLIILSTAATVIASQALISGAFSLTQQAIQMGYLPRMRICHTSEGESGQIYIPQVNMFLAISCIAVVLAFRSSSHLAEAYGMSVTLIMLINSLLFVVCARKVWNWSKLCAYSLAGVFIALETTFLASNSLKILHGGWFPLLVGLIVFLVMRTWSIGRQCIMKANANTLSLEDFIADLSVFGTVVPSCALHKVKGTAVFMATSPTAVPSSLQQNIKHNQVIHEKNIVLSFVTEKIPYVHEFIMTDVGEGFYRLVVKHGFMQSPVIGDVMPFLKEKLNVNVDSTTFFIGRETIISTPKYSGMARWREVLFIVIARNAQNAAEYFKLPSYRTAELGKQVEI